MRTKGRLRRWLECVVLALVSVVIIFLGNTYAPHLYDENSFFTDSFYRQKTERTISNNPSVIVIEFSDEFVQSLPYRSPLDRCHLSILIDTVFEYQAKTVVLDYFFDQVTEKRKDEMLRTVIKKHRNSLFLASPHASDSDLGDTEEPSLKEAVPLYHSAALKKDYDNVVRRAYLQYQGSETLAVQAVKHFKSNQSSLRGDVLIDWLGLDGNGQEQIKQIPVEYLLPLDSKVQCGTPNALVRNTTALFGALLKNKLVIIGSNYSSIDRHFTPLDFSLNDTPKLNGAAIHAQIAQQLVDGREIFEVPTWLSFGFLVLICFLSFNVSRLIRQLPSKAINSSELASELTVVVSISVIYFFILVIEYILLLYFNVAFPAGLFLIALGVQFCLEKTRFVLGLFKGCALGFWGVFNRVMVDRGKGK